MATINRTLTLNPVEPAPFSFRAVSGLQTLLKVSLYDAAGAVVRQDLGLQIQLTGRSTGVVSTYIMPSTDAANGKAAATIGAGDLEDRNGYTVNLYGTVDGGAELIGRGELKLTAGPGIDQQPSDIIDTIPLTLEYDFACSIDIHLWQDAGKSAPFDLSTATISAAVYADRDSLAALVPFSVSTIGAGHVALQLTDIQVNSLPASCWWSLHASNTAGLTTLAEGAVTIIGGGP